MGFLKGRSWPPYLMYYTPRLLLTSLSLILRYQFYADNTQLNVTNCDADTGLSRSRVEHCVADIDRWMTNNKLKLNENKTELLVISSKYRSRPMVTSIQVGVETIKHHSCCKKFGSDICKDIAMDKHITMIRKTSKDHLSSSSKYREH